MGKRPLGGYRGATPSSWSASSRTGEWDVDQQFRLNKDSQWPSPPPGPYLIDRSLRFNSADSAYLNRTPASAGNRKTWTWAGWVKRSNLTDQQAFWSAGSTGTNRTSVLFDGSAKIRFFNYAGSVDVDLVTTPVYRDASAWYHFVIAVDTTQGTASNRIKLYVNGVEVTAFSTSTYPSSSQDLVFNSAIAHGIGRGEQSGGEYFSGYLADIYFIDGQALTPTSFGEFSATTGVWMPKAYTGSYGANGFRLTFADNSAATATTLGKDAAGSNNWTPNNLSVTAGAGNDSLVDVPTNGSEVDTGAGGQVRGNYATLNPLQASSSTTLSNGNLEISSNAAGGQTLATLGVSSGKWYFEGTIITYSGTSPDPFIGISNTANPAISTGASSNPGYASNSYAVYLLSGNTYIQKVNSNTFTNTNATQVTNGDVIGVAFDLDAGKFWISKNGSWVDSGNPATGANALFTGLSGSFAPTFRGSGSSTGTAAWACNFGQRPFAYTAPSGFKALCTANLPAPTIANPSTVMDVKLYTGNGSTQTISGLGFSPDFVWIKSRNTASWWHALFDSVRGAGNYLHTNNTNGEAGGGTSLLSSFTSDGFSLNNFPNGTVNNTNDTYVAWTWDAGSSTVTNTAGSITSQVRANASAGFSVVTYTGTATSATVGHGLGVSPSFIVVKNRSGSTSWAVYHASLGSGLYIYLNSTAAAVTDSGMWVTNPTASVFSAAAYAENNGSSQSLVAYCFAPVAGYSAFGSYTGNGNADGPFVYTGFRPRWVMVKRTNSASDWWIYDTARSPYNVLTLNLYANTASAEDNVAAAHSYDFNSNGFKVRMGYNPTNNNGDTYVYAAFAESPFQYARAR